MTTRRFVHVSLVLAIAIGLVVGSGVALQAFNPQPDPPALFYGPMSILPGQAARLYVANVADPTRLVGATPSGDQLELSFFDAFGRLQAQSLEMVTPGRTAMLEFTSRDALLIRAEVRLLSGRAPFVSSMELFSSDGAVSQFVHPLSLVGFNPQPDPPKGLTR